MSRSRISYKIFLTFTIVIGLPVIGMSLILSKISAGVEESRQEDRFAYASAYLHDSIDNTIQFADSRIHQLAEDSRFSGILPFLGDQSKTGNGTDLIILMAEYGLDGIAVISSDGAFHSFSFFSVSFPDAGYGPGLANPTTSLIVDKEALRIFASAEVDDASTVVGMVSLKRTVLEVLRTAIGADFDIAPASPGDSAPIALTTRRDAFGKNMAGVAMPRLAAPAPGESMGPATLEASEESVPRLIRLVRLTPPFDRNFVAAISLPGLSGGISEVGAYLGAFALATIALAFSASLILARQIVRPLGLLLEGVNALSSRLESGGTMTPLEVRTGDEIGELTEAFNHMSGGLRAAHAELKEQNEELKELDQIKDEFLATTSAELRSPLNTLVALAESMIGSKELSKDDGRTVAFIAATGRKLYGMIDDILDYSRLEHDDLDLDIRSFELKPLTDIVLRFCSGLKKTPVELFNLVDSDLYVRADESRVEQILYNLIGYAVRTTERGSVIVRTRRDGEKVLVTVSDTGPGMGEDALSEAFKPFGTPGLKENANGLGLPIAQRLIELHGESLLIDSLPGRGTIYSFPLPLSSREETAIPFKKELGLPMEIPEEDFGELVPVDDRARDSGGDRPRYRVLAVDEDPVNLRILANGLRDRYDVMTATDGAEALRRLAAGTEPPDIVLLAVMLPKVTGYEVCAMIRKEHPGVRLPVILMTAKARPLDVEQAFAAGANDVVAKPVSIIELRARLQTHVELAKVNEAYSRFVPRDFLKLLGKESITEASLGEYIEGTMTILASDIRNFTPMSERMGPKATFIRLNEYLSRVGPIIRAHGGFIDKYIGDAIMAIFPKSPRDAIQAAIAMRKEISSFNEHAQAQGDEPIEAGIGIHTGSLMMGTIGEKARMDGTVISDVVNLAFRLEELTKAFNARIIVSGAVMEAVGDRMEEADVRYLGFSRIKGKETSVPVYELIVKDGDPLGVRKSMLRHHFEQAVFLFDSGANDEAYRAFLELGAELPEDPAWKIYVNRILGVRGYEDAEELQDTGP